MKPGCDIHPLLALFFPLVITPTLLNRGLMVAGYFSDVGLTEPMEEGVSAAVAPNLSPHGMEIYVVDKSSTDNDEDLFSSSETG